MKTKYTIIVLGISLFLILTSCNKLFLGEEIPNRQVENFDQLWQEYDLHYGTFDVKQIDWNEEYAKYRPMIEDSTPDSTLFRVMTKMLDVLNDNHVYLRPIKSSGLPWYSGGILGRQKVTGYDRQVVDNYLETVLKEQYELDFAMIPGNIGFIRLKALDSDYSVYEKIMDEALDKLKDTKGIVIDLRENDGGEDRVSQYIANRFATDSHLSFTVKVRNGPNHADFGKAIEFYTKPEGSFQYTKPVVLLTNLSVYSAGETFVLAMIQNKNVTRVGETTGGALSDAIPRELPNGWLFRVPISDVRDANGANLEEIGIEPNIAVSNTTEELNRGVDKILETAIDLLK